MPLRKIVIGNCLLCYTIHPSTHYLQVFFVVVIHNSQEERHEDVSVDNDKGNEEQGIP